MQHIPEGPTPAPTSPQIGLRFGVLTPQGRERHSVIAATNRSFTVHHAARRTRYPRDHWRAWLLQLCARGPVTVQGAPMLPPGAAALAAAVTAANQQTQLAPAEATATARQHHGDRG